jgi:hypothetical protein
MDYQNAQGSPGNGGDQSPAGLPPAGKQHDVVLDAEANEDPSIVTGETLNYGG